MQITHQADYAIRTILYLTRQEPGRRVATSRIAADEKIPASFLTKIISQLSVAGLIHTSRGARGGVALSRPASQINVLDVLVAIDGPVSLNSCVEDPCSCPFSESCLMHGFWTDASQELNERLRRTDFDTLAQTDGLST
jgi:Rrf2 family protein